MDSEPGEPFEDDAPLAHEVLGDHRLGHVREPIGRCVGGRLEEGIHEGHEQHHVACCHPLHALDHQLCRHGIDKVGEQHDQRAPVQAQVQLR